jgi:hypothetical protein
MIRTGLHRAAIGVVDATLTLVAAVLAVIDSGPATNRS